MTNIEDYEIYLSDRLKALEESHNPDNPLLQKSEQEQDLLGRISPEDVAKVREKGNKNTKIFFVLGQLKDIRAGKEEDLPKESEFFKQSNWDGEDFWVGTFRAGQEDILVLIQRSGLNEKELNEERVHQMIYFSDEDIYGVSLSAKEKQEE